MSIKTVRRLLAGVAAAGAFVAATAFPAYAAPTLQLETRDALVPPDMYGLGYAFVSVDEDDLGGPISIVVDTSALKGATFDWQAVGSDWLCAPDTATLIRCEGADLGEWVSGVSFDYAIRGDADAEIGTEGSITLTAEVNGAKATAKSVVTIAEASDLSTGSFEEGPPIVAATGDPGGLAKANAPVTNVGRSTVARTVLAISPDYRTPYAGDFSNCDYYEYAFTICTFDQPLEPGKNYRLTEDIPYAVDNTARTGAVYSSYTDWFIEDDWKIIEKSWTEYAGEPKAGTGDVLRLEEVANARRVPQTDINPWDSLIQLDVTVGGDNQVDMAAVGATASGAVGAAVTVKPTIKNLGPAALETNFEHSEKPQVRISIPEGTSVAEASWDCAPYTDGGAWPPADEAWGKPGARAYGCVVWDLYPEYTYEFEFTLTIDRAVTDAVGTITAKIDGDPNAANDSAEIVVNGTGAGGGNGGGGGGGDDGGLPVTGPQATLIASAGVLLVGAGVGGFILARRRRTRFVA